MADRSNIIPFVFGACLTLAAVGCQKGIGHAPPAVTVLPVSVQAVCNKPSFSYPITYYGRIDSARRAELSFEIPGRLVEVMVDEGDQVVAGQVVARLDTSALAADKEVLLTQRETESVVLGRLKRGERQEVIAAARAEVKKLQVDVRRLQAEANRVKRVYEGRAVSRSDYDKALFAYQSAELSLEQAEQRLEELESGTRAEDIEAQASRVSEIDAQLRRLEVQFERSSLRAPFDGVCVGRFQDEGVTLAMGQVVLAINEADRLEARFSVPQQDLPQVIQTKFVEIGGRRHPVSDVRVVSEIDALLRTVDILIPLDVPTLRLGEDGEQQLMPGQTCRLTAEKQVKTECTELPISALVASIRGLWSCYSLRPSDEDQTFTLSRVEVSIIHTDGQRVYVTSALKDQDLIVSEGVHKLAAGMSVRVVEKDG